MKVFWFQVDRLIEERFVDWRMEDLCKGGNRLSSRSMMCVEVI